MAKYAIVGTACLFPDAAPPDQFWRNLVDGVDSRRDGVAEAFGADLPDNPGAQRFAKMTVRSLQSRGTILWQCNNALMGIAHMLGERTSQPWGGVYDELKAGTFIKKSAG